MYCTNLPENCKSNELERLFSSFGRVIDCVILWDYYAFITFHNFSEAEQALHSLNGFNWKDRRLIVEWSRASGRRQQQSSGSSSSSPTTPPRLGSCASDGSTPSSPRSRPATTNGLFYGKNSPRIPPQSVSFDHFTSNPMYENLDLNGFVDNKLFFPSPSPSDCSPVRPKSNVYQPSDIASLLEPHSSDETSPIKSSNDPYSMAPSCSSAAAAGAVALFQENLISSFFNSIEPFSQLFSNDDSNNSSNRYNFLSSSPLLTTAPDYSHSPMFYSQNVSWH